jgi:hypothetical protein
MCGRPAAVVVAADSAASVVVAPVPVRLRVAAEPLLPQAQVVVAHRPVVVALRRVVVALRRVVAEPRLPPISPSFLFAMTRNMKSRATRVRCVPVPRSGLLQKDLNFLSV